MRYRHNLTMLSWTSIVQLRVALIHKGDAVTIIAKIGNLTVSMKGLAMQNGTQGQALMVKNIRSGKTVQAIAKNSNQVEVFM